jgi:hypothetical protein
VKPTQARHSRKEVREEVHPKEVYYLPFARQRGLSAEPGEGRKTLGREAAAGTPVFDSSVQKMSPLWKNASGNGLKARSKISMPCPLSRIFLHLLVFFRK